MSTRTFVGFVAEFPIRHDGDEPAGKELAKFVGQGLVESGFAVDGPSERGGWAWELYTRQEQLEIMTIVGLVDDMEATPPRQWLITNDCDVGFLKRLFGGKGLAESRERFLRRFCQTLHQIIRRDPRFSEIAWYTKETFDTPAGQPADAP